MNLRTMHVQGISRAPRSLADRRKRLVAAFVQNRRSSARAWRAIGICFVIAAILFPAGPLFAEKGPPPGTIEVSRTVDADGNTNVYCKRIVDLDSNDLRQLTPQAINALSDDNDMATLVSVMEAHDFPPPVSLIQTREERAMLRRQLSGLEARRRIANRELMMVSKARMTLDEETAANARMIRDLNIESTLHALSLLDGITSIYQDRLSPELFSQIKTSLAMAKTTADGIATMEAPAGSELRRKKLLGVLADIKGLLPSSAVGVDQEDWDKVKAACQNLSELAGRPDSDAGQRADWRRYTENLIELGSNFSPEIKAMNSSASWCFMGACCPEAGFRCFAASSCFSQNRKQIPTPYPRPFHFRNACCLKL